MNQWEQRLLEQHAKVTGKGKAGHDIPVFPAYGASIDVAVDAVPLLEPRVVRAVDAAAADGHAVFLFYGGD